MKGFLRYRLNMIADPFIIRTAESRDAPAILAVHRAAVRGVAASFYGPLIIEDWSPQQTPIDRIERLANDIASGEEVAVVGQNPMNTIVGFGSIVPSIMELRAVYVHPDFVGHGLGSRILCELEERAKKIGLEELSMDASINAEHFYQYHGYVVEGRLEHILRSGRSMACVKMRKIL
jgi:putative acetyltransferase